MNAMSDTFPTKQVIAREDRVATYNARDLIENGVQARIILDDQIYTLRITKAGKLILTK